MDAWERAERKEPEVETGEHVGSSSAMYPRETAATTASVHAQSVLFHAYVGIVDIGIDADAHVEALIEMVQVQRVVLVE